MGSVVVPTGQVREGEGLSTGWARLGTGELGACTTGCGRAAATLRSSPLLAEGYSPPEYGVAFGANQLS